MFTLFVDTDEKRLPELIIEVLRRQGYSVFAKRHNGSMNIMNLHVIKDNVLEMENKLYYTAQGQLYRTIREAIEKPLLEDVLARTDGNQLKSARILGINRNTMRVKMRKLGIKADTWKR